MELFERDCPVCQKNAKYKEILKPHFDFSQLDDFGFSSRKIPENMHYRLVRCEVCTVLYANPAPLFSDIIMKYEKANFDSDSEANYAAQTYGKYLSQKLHMIKSFEYALDIGSGNGAFLKHLLRLGFKKVIGIEPSLAPVNAAPPELRELLLNKPFNASDYEKSSLSFVSCFQTLEHVHTPGKMAKEIFELLRPGGVVFFVDHNYTSFLAKLMGTKSPIYDIEHLQLFSEKSLKKMMEQSGFTRVVVFRIVNAYPISYWIRLLPLSIGFKNKLISLAEVLSISKVLIPLPVGNIGTIGVKPG